MSRQSGDEVTGRAIVTPDDGIAWVTGASSGIGKAVALELANEGWRVAVTARRRPELTALSAKNSTIFPYAADVTDRAQMARTLAQIESEQGPVALAIFNAGVYLPMEAFALDLDKFALTLETNLMGTVNGLAPVIPGMIAAGKGHIVLVASATGYGGLPTSAAYGASKAALINLAETLDIELHRHHIRVSVVNPGFIDTPATQDNSFPMPFLMPVEEAAHRIIRGLKSDAFEITFPRRFTYMLKILGFLPARLRLNLIRKFTRWN